MSRPTEKAMLLSADHIAALLRAFFAGQKAPALPAEITYEDLYQTAELHQLTGAVYSCMEADFPADCPDTLREKFRRARDVSFFRHSVQAAEFSALTTALTAEKIPFLPLKGFLLKELYPAPEMRTMSDMDFYVGEENADRAAAILLSRGYRLTENGYIHLTFTKPPLLEVELHKHISEDFDRTFSDFLPKEGEDYWFLLKAEDFLFYELLHACKHYFHGGCGIRDVLDLRFLFAKYGEMIDRAAFDKRLKKAGLLSFSKRIRELSGCWFDGAPFSREIRVFSRSVVLGGKFGDAETEAENSIREKGKFRYILSKLFPPYKPRMVAYYPWLRKAPVLLPVAWGMRLVRSLFNGHARRRLSAIRKAETKKN